MLVVSMYTENEYGERCLRAGARGYLDKGADFPCYLAAVREVLARLYASRDLATRLWLRRGEAPKREPASLISQLSDREHEIFILLGHGRTTAEIADHLHIAEHTVENQYRHIEEKLGLPSARHLAVFAAQWVQNP